MNKLCLLMPSALCLMACSPSSSNYEKAMSLVDTEPVAALVLLERAAANGEHEADARLQLALLYEKQKETSAQAAWELRRYLALNPEGADRKTIENWILRCEKAYQEHLKDLLGDGGLDDAKLQVKYLTERTIQQKNDLNRYMEENYQLREELSKATEKLKKLK